MECDQVTASESDDSFTGTTPKKTKRSSKTSKEQFEKLISFMKCHSDFTRRKPDDQLMLDWEVLCGELNSMGHAVHSTKEWRKVWTDYKGKKKQRLSVSSTPVVQPQTDFELTIPINVSSITQSTFSIDVPASSHSLTDLHGDSVTQSSFVRSESMISHDNTILGGEILKKLDDLVEIHLKAVDDLKELKDMIIVKFNSQRNAYS